MTDEQIMEFCESRRKKINSLKRQREKLPEDKTGQEKWDYIKNEILSVTEEIKSKASKPGWKSEDAHTQMTLMQLILDAVKEELYYMPKY